MTPRMDEDWNEISRRLLTFTQEIISLLSGEDYTIVRKTPGDGVNPIIHLQESGGRSQNPITEPPPHPLIHERKKKILELNNKMIELLTGEVPIRCQDVAVYLSMEESEYLEGHKDRYMDIIMEELWPLTPQDGSKRSPERKHSVPESHQGEDLTNIKVEVEIEEKWTRGSESYMSDVKEEDPVDVTTANPDTNTKSDSVLFLNYKVEDEDVKHHSPEENLITLNIKSEFDSTKVIYNPTNPMVPSPDQSQIVQSTAQRGRKKFQCSECGKCFANQSNRVRHQRVHTGEKPYSCSECGKRFTQRSSFVEHQKIHTGVKPYSCSECGKCFRHHSGFIKHQRRHTGEKPYSCAECEKCFSDQSSVARHKTIHTGEKPYSCSECGQCFTFQSDLVKHKRIHTGEKPYLCTECGKSFTDKSYLVKHQRIHIGKNQF